MQTTEKDKKKIEFELFLWKLQIPQNSVNLKKNQNFAEFYIWNEVDIRASGSFDEMKSISQRYFN